LSYGPLSSGFWLLPVVRYPLVRRVFPSLLLLIAISSGALFFRLGSLPLSGADEPRYARIAQEMHDRGTWVTPSLEGKPWLEKPPLYYWITEPFYSVFKTNETAARVGPALCALITALAVFWLGSELWSTGAGLIGASILLTSLGFAGYGRSASTDMPFTCCFTLSMAILLHGGRLRTAARREAPLGSVLLAYLLLGLAVLGKGPVAIVLAGGIVLCVWFLDERGGVLRTWRVLPGLVLAAIVSVPWFWLVFRQNGFGFISTFFINHNIARYVTGIHHHSQPALYYLPVLLALLFPWSGWLALLVSKSPLQAVRRWRHWDLPMVFLACWFLVPIIFFSLSDSKLAGYILPSLPPLALILGIYISRAEQSRLRLAAGLNLLVSAAMAVAAPLLFEKEYGNWKIGLLISVVTLVPAFFSFAFNLKGKCHDAFGVTVMQGLILIVVVAQFAFPVMGAYYSTRDIAHLALELRHPGEPMITYQFSHHTLHYYTGYQIAGQLDDKNSLVQFARLHPNFLVVTKSEAVKEIGRIKELSASPVGEQGDFHLLRISNTEGN